jgi:hypothetical protein
LIVEKRESAGSHTLPAGSSIEGEKDMSWRSVRAAAAFIVSAVVLTVSLALARDKDNRPFHAMGVVKSVDVAQKRLALEYAIAPTVVVKSGSESKSLSDLMAGMPVRLRGVIATQGPWTVNEVLIRSTQSEKPQHRAAPSHAVAAPPRQSEKSSEGRAFEAMGIVKSVDTDRKYITLEYSLAPNVFVKSGHVSKSLSDLSAGMEVRLQGSIDAHGAWTVHGIHLWTAHSGRPMHHTTQPSGSTGRY